jgi:hypothetical protein
MRPPQAWEQTTMAMSHLASGNKGLLKGLCIGERLLMGWPSRCCILGGAGIWCWGVCSCMLLQPAIPLRDTGCRLLCPTGRAFPLMLSCDPLLLLL